MKITANSLKKNLNTMDFENISKISEDITNLLKTDDFFQGIQPKELRDAVKSYPLRGGKRLRPTLALWTCGLLEENPQKAIFAAAAAEVYHNWTLVHDDIIDNDDMRRGKPSTHKELSFFAKNKYKLNKTEAEKYGIAFAILAGDLQQSWAINLILKTAKLGIPENVVRSICQDMVQDLSVKLISGEALDVTFSYKSLNNITNKEIENMLYLKTSALLNFCTIAGAKIALKTTNNEHEKIKKLTEFTTSLGIAFQLRDDWLGIFGNAEKLGKPICSDVSSAKPTLLMMETLKRTNAKSKQILFSLLGKNKISKKETETVKKIIKNSGAEEFISNKISTLKIKAAKALSSFPDNNYKKLLLGLNEYLVTREY